MRPEPRLSACGSLVLLSGGERLEVFECSKDQAPLQTGHCGGDVLLREREARREATPRPRTLTWDKASLRSRRDGGHVVVATLSEIPDATADRGLEQGHKRVLQCHFNSSL